MYVQNLDLILIESYEFVGKEITFQNCKIDMNKFKIIFKDYKKIIFYNCEIINMDEIIYINNCNYMSFKNSIFKGNDSNRCVEIKCGNKIEIVNCKFDKFSSNQRETSRYGAYFGCLYMKDVKEVLIDMSCFNNCCSKNWNRGEADIAVGGIYGAEKIKFNKCHFFNCKNRIWQYGQTWKEEGHMFQFSNDLKPDFGSCTFKDCVEII